MNILKFLSKPVHAVKLGELRGPGAIGLEGASGDQAIGMFTKVISTIIGIMTVAGALWFLFNFIAAAYTYISAGQDQQKITEAQREIQNSFIGLFLIVAAVFALSLIGNIIGIEFLEFGDLFERITDQAFK